MKALFLALAVLMSVPSYSANRGQGQLVAAHQEIVTDAHLDLTANHAHDSLGELVEMCNLYAGRRQVVLRVNARNDLRVINAFRARARVRNVRNVRVVFVQNQRVRFANRNQVRVVVRAGNRGLFNRVFANGFGRGARNQAVVVIGRQVRG